MVFKCTYFQNSTHTTQTHTHAHTCAQTHTCTESYIRAMGWKKRLLRRERFSRKIWKKWQTYPASHQGVSTMTISSSKTSLTCTKLLKMRDAASTKVLQKRVVAVVHFDVGIVPGPRVIHHQNEIQHVCPHVFVPLLLVHSRAIGESHLDSLRQCLQQSVELMRRGAPLFQCRIMPVDICVKTWVVMSLAVLTGRAVYMICHRNICCMLKTAALDHIFNFMPGVLRTTV